MAVQPIETEPTVEVFPDVDPDLQDRLYVTVDHQPAGRIGYSIMNRVLIINAVEVQPSQDKNALVHLAIAPVFHYVREHGQHEIHGWVDATEPHLRLVKPGTSYN